MKEITPLEDQRIINCLHADYGLDTTSLTRLSLGADMEAFVFKAKTQNQFYFVKLKAGLHHDISLEIVELLCQAGVKEIIVPLKTVHGQSSKLIEDFTLIVYPFIDGQDGFSRNLTNEQWVALGKALRQVHAMDIPLPIQNRIRRETFSPKWREIVRSLYMHIETKPSGDETAMTLIEFMKDNTSTIYRLVNRAEQLGQKLQNETQVFVLCHSDIHGGNVLIDDKDKLYIVDWDELIMAPKERDLMFIGGAVANVWNKSHEETLFYQGYGETHVNREILAYYRHERINEDIAIYGQALLLASTGDENRKTLFKHFMSMFEHNGVVEIAFKTDVY